MKLLLLGFEQVFRSVSSHATERLASFLERRLIISRVLVVW
jgi:hypothetical protein